MNSQARKAVRRSAYTAGSVVAAAAKQAIKMYKAASAYKARRNPQPKYRRSGAKPLVKKEYIAKGDGIESKFDIRNPPSQAIKVMKKVNAPNTEFRQTSFPVDWAVGRQAVRTTQIFQQADFNNMFSNIPATTLAGNINRRILIDKHSSETTFTNGTNATCYVYVYDIVCKTDIDTADGLITGPDVAWQNGEIQQGNATGYHVIGSDPKKVDMFREHFKILKVEKHFMKPGDTHKHFVNVNMNKIVNEARTVASIRYAGITYFTMLVAHGCPAQDDTAGVPVVSTTAGTINVTQTMRYSYRYSLDNQANHITHLLLPQPTALEVITEDVVAPVTTA